MWEAAGVSPAKRAQHDQALALHENRDDILVRFALIAGETPALPAKKRDRLN